MQRQRASRHSWWKVKWKNEGLKLDEVARALEVSEGPTPEKS